MLVRRKTDHYKTLYRVTRNGKRVSVHQIILTAKHAGDYKVGIGLPMSPQVNGIISAGKTCSGGTFSRRQLFFLNEMEDLSNSELDHFLADTISIWPVYPPDSARELFRACRTNLEATFGDSNEIFAADRQSKLLITAVIGHLFRLACAVMTESLDVVCYVAPTVVAILLAAACGQIALTFWVLLANWFHQITSS